jgi:hypothetical protein
MEMQAQPLTGLLKNAPHDYTALKKALRLVSAVALLAGTMSLVAQERQPPEVPSAPSEAKHTIARKLTLAGVPRFGEVTPTLYRGGQPSKEGFGNLAGMGVNIVVDLRGSRENERRIVTRLGMRYVPLHWQCFSPRDEHFAQFLTLLRANPGKKVFVHCRVGDDRTGMDIAAYRMAEQGWTAEEAGKEMEAYGVDWFHRRICPRLSSYEKNFPERFKTSAAFRSLRSGKDAPGPQP